MRRCGEEEGDFLEKMRPVARCRVRHPHPPEDHLERFVRGELPRLAAQSLVRHLLSGCPRCVAVTRRAWKLRNRSRVLEILP
jgi:hypothetical protein